MSDTPRTSAAAYLTSRGYVVRIAVAAQLERELAEARSLTESYRDNDHDLTLQNSINNPPKPLLPWEEPTP